MTTRLLRLSASLPALLAAAVVRAAACPVCYGAPDSSSTQGMTAGIFALLGVTGGVLAAFATMFIRLGLRSRALAAAADVAGQRKTTTVKETDIHG